MNICISRSSMPRYTDGHTYTHMEILPEEHTQMDIFLHSISGSIYGLIF